MSCSNSSAASYVGNVAGDSVSGQIANSVNGVGSWTIPKGGWGSTGILGGRRKKYSRGKKHRRSVRSIKRTHKVHKNPKKRTARTRK